MPLTLVYAERVRDAGDAYGLYASSRVTEFEGLILGMQAETAGPPAGYMC